MKDILQKIHSAPPSEINEILQALLDRYSCLFPDWEIAFLSRPKSNVSDRNKQLNEIIDFLSSLRDS